MSTTTIHTVPLPADGVRSKRRHVRVQGPFDGFRLGLLDVPVRIFDLSEGGCFVNSTHAQRKGAKFKLKIDLPKEGWVTVKAETLYLRPGGFAVQFFEVDPATNRRLERAIAFVVEEQSGQL